MDLLVPYRLGLLVMAGYMLIVSPAMCRRYALLNLHPALPGGPTGTWQQVIWQTARGRSDGDGRHDPPGHRRSSIAARW